MPQDIRKWFLKPHDKDKGKDNSSSSISANSTITNSESLCGGKEGSGRRKTSKYFAADKQKLDDEKGKEELPAKRKTQNDIDDSLKSPQSKKIQKVDDNDDDFVLSNEKRNATGVSPSKKLKSGSARGVAPKSEHADESVEDNVINLESPLKSTGRGRGARASEAPPSGIGRGGGRGRFMNFGERKDPPHKGEKEVPEGAPDCLAGLTFVISGTLDSLEREEAEALIKRHGGRVTGSISKKTSYLLCDEDIGGVKSSKAKELGTAFLTEDGLFDMIRASNLAKAHGQASEAPPSGRGRGGGRGRFMNFGERKDPPHKGEKEVPEGAPDCLAGLTFVISGTLDSLEREEAEALIKRHGGRVTGSISKKTSYLLCDEDIGGVKSSKAKELGTAFLTEDGLFDMIRASNLAKAHGQDDSKKSVEKAAMSLPVKQSPKKVKVKSNSSAAKVACESTISHASPVKKKEQNIQDSSLTWTEKHRPKVPSDIVGNQSLVNQLHNWLAHWNEQFLGGGTKQNGKKKIDPSSKKAVLLSGAPGMGKTTSAKLVSEMLGFQAIEVNASDSRGKADSKISKGIGGSNANSVKELVSNEALNVKMDRSKHPKAVLIMDEVDGMSAGDRGGVADLIASIKISKIPIICICNDRYSQKLKSLVNYCLLLSFRKPTKQQMAKRLMQIANAEGLQVNEIALEELAERVNGDIRMAINQLQYMSLSMSNIKYDDIRQRLLTSAKDEDISPFTAVDKLFGFNGGRLRMDERIDLSMSDPDLVPLLIQENYINYRPNLAGKDEMKRMSLIARAAESIGDGDIVNVQIRRYRQWQLSQTGCLASCIIPAALLHGQRETLEQGERNFNRFGGWLGKNSTMGKNLRLLEDLHVHLLASRESNLGRETLRLEYLTLLLKQLTDPLREMPKDEAVRKVVDFMNIYSISQEDFDTVVELSKFQGHGNPLEGIPPAVKSALTRAYNEESKLRMVRAADLVSLPGKKAAPKKRIAAILEPSDEGLGEENGAVLDNSEEENASDTEDPDTVNGEKVQKELQSLNSKGIEVQVELKGSDSSSAKKKAAGRGKGGSASSEKKDNSGSTVKKGGRGSGGAAKRKR